MLTFLHRRPSTRVLGQAALGLLLPLLATSACSSQDDAAEQTPPATEIPRKESVPVTYHACPAGYIDECAILPTPVDHADPNGPTIDLHIARRRATGASKRQLWLLAGGPGQAGSIWAPYIEFMVDLPDTDIFVMDHRGTGYSHRLTCKAQDKPNTSGGYVLPVSGVSSCLAELEAKGDKALLAHMTTTQAARDLALAIRATREPGQEVVVMGGSYGTHLAHRFLQVAPDLPTSIIFDGFMTPNAFSFSQYDQGIDEIGKVLAEGCAKDGVCGTKMGADPYERTRAVIEKRKATACGSVDGETTRLIASWLIERREIEPLFPFVHRVERCTAGDEEAIDTMLAQLNAVQTGAPPAEEFLHSGVLQYNIALSELWSRPGDPAMTPADYEAAAAKQVFLMGDSYPASIAHLRKTWPLPTNDYADLPVPVKSNVNLLWLAGGLDTRTPPAQAKKVTALYDQPNQPFILIPGASHTPTLGSPRASNSRKFCGNDIALSFVRDPSKIDRSCLEDLKPVRYAGGKDSEAYWGTSDDWGDETNVGTGGTSMASANRGAKAKVAATSLRWMRSVASLPPTVRDMVLATR